MEVSILGFNLPIMITVRAEEQDHAGRAIVNWLNQYDQRKKIGNALHDVLRELKDDYGAVENVKMDPIGFRIEKVTQDTASPAKP